MTVLSASLLVLGALAPAAGQALDAASAAALDAAVGLLRDPSVLAGAIAGNAQAGAADREVRALAGSEGMVQEFYELAAQIFGEIATTLGGDTTKIGETLARAQREPEAFAALLSPATRQRLGELAGKVSDRRR